MSIATSSELSLIDRVVNGVSDALVSSTFFRSLCSTALHRHGRSVVLRHLTTALAAFSQALRKSSDDPASKATAWMLQGCGTAIALRVCELINPEKNSLAQLLAALDQDPLTSNLDRLREFLVANFKAGEQFPATTAQDWGFESSDDQQTQAVVQDGTNDLPDLEALSKVEDFKDIVCALPALNALCTALMKALFSSHFRLLKTTLRQYVLDNGQKYSIACVLEWQLLEYIRHEKITLDDLEYLFTINGVLGCASISQLGDYVRSIWKTGETFLSLLKELVRKINTTGSTRTSQGIITIANRNIELQMFPASKSTREQCYLKLSGTYDTLVEILEQFAWVAATLRPHFEGQLTVSDIDFRAEQAPISTPQNGCPPIVFYLSIFGKNKTLQADGRMPGQCWASVFTESVLAHGFPSLTNDRPSSALGLELPFEFMAAFTGIKYPVMIEESIVFANESSVLTPEHKIDSDSIQWHFQRSERWLEKVIPNRTTLKDNKLQTLNLSSYTHARAFFGHSKYSETLLGTKEFEHVDAAESGVESVSKVAFESHIADYGLRVDHNGNVTAADGTRWRFNRGEMTQIRGPDMVSDSRLLQALRNSVLLYDQESCVGSLVSELSLVLQLVTAHLRTESSLKRQRIPLASLAADGGRAAYECILKAKDVVVTFPNAQSQKYIKVVEDFLDLVEQRKTQTLARKQFNGGKIADNFLRGWDHASLQATRHEVFERQMQSQDPKVYPTWWKLFQNSKVLVLFTKLSKIPIRNSSLEPRFGSFNCRAWDDLPQGQHLFFTSAVQLRRLTATVCQNSRRYATRYMLNDNLIWARPRSSRLFEQDCQTGGFCNPVQTMIEGSSGDGTSQDPPPGWTDESEFFHNPGKIEDTGAIVFGDDPDSNGKRPCWRHARTPMLGQTEWNYPYIAVTFVVIVLAWWNFRLLVVNLILLAIARYLK